MAADGQIRERVYRELKRKLVEGEIALDQHLDLRALSTALHSSPTPVKEALVRLTGERLVIAKEKGFQVARWTTPQLQSLYAWRRTLVFLALEDAPHVSVSAPDGSRAYAAEVRRVLGALEAQAGDEHHHAAGNADDRLGYARLIEPRLWSDVEAELDALCRELGEKDARKGIDRYFRRRIDAASAIRDGAILRSHPNGD